MTQRPRFNIFLIAICLLIFNSCDRNELTPIVQETPTPALGGGDCVLNTTYWFPLTYGPTNATNNMYGEYKFTLETGSFYSNTCMCMANRYEIEIPYIPPQSEVVVRDKDGGVINEAYVVSPPGGGGTEGYKVIIPSIEQLTDPFITVYVDFLNDPTPTPSIARAGGLCIVENYGGTGDPPSQYTSPIRIGVENYPPGSGTTYQIWIPTSMGVQQ